MNPDQATLAISTATDRGFAGNPPITREAKWYAVYLRSRYERKVCEALHKKRIDCFLPLAEEVRVWSDRKKRIQVPLFPGYIFVWIDLRQRLAVLKTDGVVHFVGISNRPSPIPEDQIRWVKIVVGCPEAVRRVEYLSTGQLVEVTAGAFKGVRGFVSRFRGSTRIVISLESIAQSVSVEVAPEFLEPVAQGAASSEHVVDGKRVVR